MRNFLLLTLNIFLFTSILIPQEIIVSSFDIDSEGWYVSGGILHYHSSDGNPSGFIEFEDNQDGKGTFTVPDKFLGDLLLYKQGTLEFDLKNTVNNAQTMLWGYGEIKISSSTYSAEKNVVPLEYINDWTTFSIPLNHDDWGMNETGWDSLLAEVTEISIQMDAQWDYYDRTGIDNFSIVPFTSSIEDDPNTIDLLSYHLYQNYPNPFNPSTRISWQSPVGSHQTIKVFDVLGNEIATLVDEYKHAGRYEVEFSAKTGSAFGGNAYSLSSGVYFCRLKTENFSKGIKMLFLK